MDRLLSVKDITVLIDGVRLVDSVSFDAYQNEVLMIVGPNGAGKSTLIRAIMGTVNHSGIAYINGQDISRFRPIKLARHIGVLTQYNNLSYSFSVLEVVRMGRYAHIKDFLKRLTHEDERMVERAISMTGIEHLKERSVLTLSGGEIQRVFLAQLFAQDPDVLILDEPTNHLDLQYQIHIFEIIKEWVKGEGKTVVAVVHDLNLALHYGQKAVLLKQGKAVSSGDIKSVLSKQNLDDVYSIDVLGYMNSMLSNWNDVES